MSGQFKVGDEVRIVIDPSTTDVIARTTDGQEAVISGGIGFYDSRINGAYAGVIWGYLVIAANGMQVLCEPHELRKKSPPPTDESASRQAMLDCIERARRGIEEPA